VELASNLVWAILAICLLSATYSGVRRGSIRLSMTSAMMLGLLLCFILLPVISLSDDMLASRQAALPLAGQSWRIASEDAAIGLDLVLAMAAYLLLLLCVDIETHRTDEGYTGVRATAGWLVRAQRLRPPPCFA
jgi:hypothetical protein